jgi:hypothetical protein
MPRAVANLEDTTREDLKSCPGAFVVLRRMTYGQKLERQSMAMQMGISGNGKNAEMNVAMMQQQSTAFEFRHCIADHNLDDENDQRLDFNNPVSVFKLDPRIGEEIEMLIADMNNFEDTDEAKNSATGS